MKLDFLHLLKEIPEAISESADSRARRNVQARRLIAPPPPGTPLLVSLALAFEHTGIYLGGNRVAELGGNGDVQAVSLTQFVNGSSDGVWTVRNGTRIFAACDAWSRRPLASAQTLATARAAVEDGASPSGYDFAQTNCHLFTAGCVCGILPGERRFHTLLGGGVASVGKLENLLSKSLNGGNAICWRAVRRGKKGFCYSLTPEKQIRLAVEGRR